MNQENRCLKSDRSVKCVKGGGRNFPWNWKVTVWAHCSRQIFAGKDVHGHSWSKKFWPKGLGHVSERWYKNPDIFNIWKWVCQLVKTSRRTGHLLDRLNLFCIDYKCIEGLCFQEYSIRMWWWCWFDLKLLFVWACFKNFSKRLHRRKKKEANLSSSCTHSAFGVGSQGVPGTKCPKKNLQCCK